MATLEQAVLRINRGLGFLPSGHGQTNDILQCLEEAQRDLEKGKTLPRFLLQEDQSLTLPVNESKIALPSDFLRPDDDNPIYYIAQDSNLPYYLKHYRSYKDAVLSVQSTQRPDQPMQGTDAPTIYVIRGPDSDIPLSLARGTIDFILRADAEYAFTWNYYRSAGAQLFDEENLWLVHAPEWLIGEAGRRMAMDKRDQAAVGLFTDMMQKGRMAAFADDLAFADAGGPIQMGANL